MVRMFLVIRVFRSFFRVVVFFVFEEVRGVSGVELEFVRVG